MNTLNHYHVHIILKLGLIRGKLGSTFTETKVDILAENEERYCLNTIDFMRIDKSGSGRINYVLGKHSVYSHANDTCFGTEIKYNLYTDKVKRKSTIKKEIAKHVNDNYGHFHNIDLSFLDQDKVVA